ncbi:MAG: hypothetical protein AAF391_02335 [Bacteroidota bacterium]
MKKLVENQAMIVERFTLFISKVGRLLFAALTMMSCFTAISQDTENDEASDTTQISEMLSSLINFDTTNTNQVVERKSYIGLTLKQNKEGVILRWAPTTRELFDRGNELGYVIKRYEYPSGEDTLTVDEDSFIETWVAGPKNPVKSYDSATWVSHLPIEDKYAIIAAGATTGSLEASSEIGFGVKSKQDNSMFGYTLLAADLSKLAADGLGFRFVDKNVRIGKDYEYRVILNDPKEIAKADSIYALDAFELDSAQLKQWGEWFDEQQYNIIQFEGKNPEQRSIQGLFSSSTEKSVDLFWSVHDNPGFSGYIIERSEDGGQTYDSLTKNIFVSKALNLIDTTHHSEREVYYYTDQLDTNYVKYTYRITAYDAFADVSAPSFVTGMGRDLTGPVAPEIISGNYEEEENRILLKYHLPEIPSDFSELYVEYANTADTVYQRYTNESLNPKDSIYYHQPGRHEHSHYFRLVAKDTADNQSVSFPVFVNIPDTIPPPKPKGVVAQIDTTGKVHIEWQEEYIEARDLLGFRVYYSNNPTREFSQLTTKPEISHFYSYHIPLNTLTEKIYFKVQAVDNSYNHSEFSDIVEAQKPDTIPPVAPVFRSPKVDEEKVVLSWASSSSRDLEGYLLTKQTKDGDPVSILIEDLEINSYTDTELETGVRYYYTIVAIDDAGLHSKNPYELQVKLVDKKRLESVSNLKVKYNKNQDSVTISWDSELKGDDVKFVIYRNVDDEKLKRYHLVDGSKYVDQVKQEGTYYYGVRVLKKDGSKSSLSETISTKVK